MRRRDRHPESFLSLELRDRLYQASSDAAPDMGRAGRDPEAVVEASMTLLDVAATHEYRTAQLLTEARQHIQERGWPAFLAEAAKYVGTL